MPRPRLSLAVLAAALVLSACGFAPLPPVPPPAPGGAAAPAGPPLRPQDFIAVADAVEPVAEAVCRAQTPDQDCDFAIFVDTDLRSPPNAFQTLDAQGRPVVIVTLRLIALMEGRDELAFVLGHEAGHHIARHIPGRARSAEEGARILAGVAAARGAGQREVARAAELGALVGSRRYSQAAELEADAIGTAIAWRAGYDPLRGARLFQRLPDPGAAFLSTHPPNAARLDVVRETLLRLGAGS